MYGGKGRCMERWVGGAHEKSIINRIMLRFRPIAPKPANGESVTGGLLPEKKNMLFGNKREKRKYVKVRRNTTYKRKKETSDEERKDGVDKTAVTLQLLPEKTENKDSPAGGSWCNLDRTVTTRAVQDSSTRLNFNNMGGFNLSRSDRVAVAMRLMPVVESWLTVECVTETCIEGGGLGSTDLERMRNLERDTCPGFISDGYNRVEWINEAYKRMMVNRESDGQAEKSPPDIMVCLVTKEKFQYPAFTSRLRVQYTTGKEKFSRTVPCDTWRMDCGVFAWRLDVKAALSLGR